ncbi:DgyrCDS125 [Dimorphilus gyrociliatus]|uniref:Vesicle transport protein n=1 Tax=Dimorphilus gyrociliatus TaxID=2664684 RepID=A0A7I8V683_9ANNE|nr:DgyrCDS125 [Dimorphilus gyrociliatus]
MDKLKRVLGGRDEEEEGIMTQISDSTSLSFSTRVKCFAVCFVVGIVLSILGTVMLFFQKWAVFAVLYTLGNITALASTCFLMGPCSQLKKMFAETRIFATIIVFIMMALTLCAGLWWKIAALALVFCALQFVAMAWYSLSYIPFARDAVKKCAGSCMGE